MKTAKFLHVEHCNERGTDMGVFYFECDPPLTVIGLYGKRTSKYMVVWAYESMWNTENQATWVMTGKRRKRNDGTYQYTNVGHAWEEYDGINDPFLPLEERGYTLI